MTDPVRWDEARRRAHRAAVPLLVRPVALAGAAGAVLGAPLVAAVALPTADCSATDGHAVRGPAP
ncbi:hypothetical protein [Pseudonocardia humida]|uniref:MoeA N-terminal and linker domain-containing protein n=1 Tax=Pseudonocardia humida TaxID=2800819 RepID=A0ABT0ZXC8_9PSEU|nr:hypothetical protein [Pseudonocardia humida]MCO1655279.1 hypothetical protein [Pseudonocardia humida]